MTVLATLSLLIWIYLLFARGRFWRVSENLLPSITANKPERNPRVIAVIPARDEAPAIGFAVQSLLKSDLPIERLILVDDSSTDGTAQVARKAAIEIDQAHRLAILRGQPLAPGWTGKLWALVQGVEKALELAPDYLLFTDADIVHESADLLSLVSLTEQHSYDLASLMVKLSCRSAAEKALIPAFVYFFLQLYPPAWIARRKAHTAGAAGGCILIRSAALARAGGLAVIRNAIIDDCALARTVKRSGGRVWLGLTAATRSIRPYDTFGELGRMITRTAFSQLQHSSWLLLATIAALLLTYVVPLLALLSAHGIAAAFGLTAWVLMSASYLPMVRFYRLSSWRAATLPAISLFYLGATIYSALRYWFGAGGEWKGRMQDVRAK